jgi:prefoldin alpha subunit
MENKGSHEQEMQENLILYQLLQKHLEELSNQATLLEGRLMELENTSGTLSDLKGMKEKGELVFSLGSGCYGYGRLDDRGKVMVDIGAGTLVNKTPAQAESFLEEKKEEIKKLSEKLVKEVSEVSERMNTLAAEIQKDSEKQGSK